MQSSELEVTSHGSKNSSRSSSMSFGETDQERHLRDGGDKKVPSSSVRRSPASKESTNKQQIYSNTNMDSSTKASGET